jgi:hypothetical protein
MHMGDAVSQWECGKLIRHEIYIKCSVKEQGSRENSAKQNSDPKNKSLHNFYICILSFLFLSFTIVI